MIIKYHGIKYGDNNNSGYFLHGTLRFLMGLSIYFLHPKMSVDEKRPIWTNKWFDRKFEQAVTKLHQTFYHFDRTAFYLTKCKEIIDEYFQLHTSSKDLNVLVKFDNSLGDLPLYLDLAILYSRIQADCLANVIPNLYGQQELNIPRDSFNKQRRWFIKKCPSFDTKFTDILQSSTKWFDLLAGEKTSRIRDVIVHYRGTYQISSSFFRNIKDESKNHQLQASLVNESGFICEDLISTIKEIVGGYYCFLDQIYIYFSNKIQEEIGEEFLPINDSTAQLYAFGKASPNFWIYPEITV